MGILKTGDIVCGTVIADTRDLAAKGIPWFDNVYVSIGNSIVFVSEESLSKQKENKHIFKDKDEFILYDGTVITKDGYIECPYASGVKCSIYLKNKSCKDCFGNK